MEYAFILPTYSAGKCIKSALWEDRELLFGVFAYFHCVNTPIMTYILYKTLERDAHNWIQQESALAHHCYSPN